MDKLYKVTTYGVIEDNVVLDVYYYETFKKARDSIIEAYNGTKDWLVRCGATFDDDEVIIEGDEVGKLSVEEDKYGNLRLENLDKQTGEPYYNYIMEMSLNHDHD